MLFGICTPVERSAAAKAAGWDFVEENIQSLFQGQVADSQWTGLKRVQASAVLPVLAANCLVPASIPIVGPAVDAAVLRKYISNVLARAQKVGMKTLVFGSGGARKAPAGFDAEKTRRQILDFVTMTAEIAARHDVIIVVEPLNKGETNTINSVGEAMSYVKAVNHPNLQCLVDSWHYWLENDSPDDLKAAMPWIRHVHLADTEGRVPPGESGKSDYRPFFKILKEARYDGPISVESPGFDDIEGVSPRVLELIKKQWREA